MSEWSAAEKAQLEKRKAEDYEKARRFAAKYYRIKLADVICYHSGICYSTCWVRTEAAAKRIAAKVEGDTVNGGMYHGCALGHIEEQESKDGTTTYRVMC